MNSVHEPGPNADSKHYRVEKPGRKTSQVHEHQNWPNWPSGTPGACRPGRIVAGPGRVVAEGPGRITSPGCRVAALTRAPLHAVPRAPCHASLRAVSCV